VNYADLPLLPRAAELAEAGYVTGASGRNWASYGEGIRLANHLTAAQHALLTDPQTSGGLLVSCSPDAVTEVLSIFLQQGFSHVSVIGEMLEGPAGIEVV
jgi:selenide,water dikinase